MTTITTIVKRDGRTTDFQIDKIMAAMQKAFDASGVTLAAKRLLNGQYPNTPSKRLLDNVNELCR